MDYFTNNRLFDKETIKKGTKKMTKINEELQKKTDLNLMCILRNLPTDNSLGFRVDLK